MMPFAKGVSGLAGRDAAPEWGISDGVVAGFAGVTIPLILTRCGVDPAIASAVFLTTMTDVVGFFAFLGLATIFVI